VEKDVILSRLLQAVELTRDTEIDCSTCFDLMPVYIDREISGANAAEELPELRDHLVQCQECREAYEALGDLAALETADAPPDRSTLLHRLRHP
jgi:predicted anti-sigma-YlaC factor YlaD